MWVRATLKRARSTVVWGGWVVAWLGVAACAPETKTAPTSVPQGSTVVVLDDGTAVAVDEDNNTVVFVNLHGGAPYPVSVGKGPTQMAVRGNQLVVSNRRDRWLSATEGTEPSAWWTWTPGRSPGALRWGQSRMVWRFFPTAT